MYPENPRDGAFIVRIWWEMGDERALKWRGQAVNTQTRRTIYFDGIPELIAFIEEWSGILPSSVSSGRQDNHLAAENKNSGGLK